MCQNKATCYRYVWILSYSFFALFVYGFLSEPVIREWFKEGISNVRLTILAKISKKTHKNIALKFRYGKPYEFFSIDQPRRVINLRSHLATTISPLGTTTETSGEKLLKEVNETTIEVYYE